VLQRIAICYLVASVIVLNTSVRGQVIWLVALLALYWLAVMMIPVPGYGAGVLEPTGSLCWYIDSQLLAGHTWSGAPAPGFDPEGILSTIPAIGTTLMGVLTGHLLRSSLSKEEKTVWLFVGGNTLLLAGVVMDIWLPINKNLWTSSYTVFMAGWASVCLGMFYWIIDVKGHRTWATPLLIYGMNAITVFVLAGLVARLFSLIKIPLGDGTSISLKGFLYQNLFAAIASPVNASLLYALFFIFLMFIVAWVMWRKRWFVKV
jgi:predicted acyltransferase